MREVNLAYYKKTDWKRLLESVDDRDSMHDTWKEWHKAYQKAKIQLIASGFIVKEIVVDIDDLIHFCKTKGIKNNGEARSKFVTKS